MRKAGIITLLSVSCLFTVSFVMVNKEHPSAVRPYTKVTEIEIIHKMPVAKAERPKLSAPAPKAGTPKPQSVFVPKVAATDQLPPAKAPVDITATETVSTGTGTANGDPKGIATGAGTTKIDSSNYNGDTKGTGPEKYVDVMPEFNGNLNKYLEANLHYPEDARNANVQGKVLIQFVVDVDGSITDLKCVRGLGFGCDAEAIKILSKMPKWKPGKLRGKAVRTQYVQPITFTLE